MKEWLNQYLKRNGTNFNKKYSKIFFIFIIVFVVSKSITFLTPLFLSNHLFIKQYALIEYGISIGSLIAAIISFGQDSAFPYFYIRRNKKNIASLIHLHSFLPIILGVLILFLWFFNYQKTLYWGLIFGIFYSLQTLLSSKFKTYGKVSIAVLIDSFFYICLLVLLIFPASKFHFSSTFGLILCFVTLSVINFYNINKISIRNSIKWFKKSWKHLYSYGLSALFSSVSLFAFSVSPRVVVEQIISLEALGIFSFYFRLSAFSVVIFQALNIYFFKKIFEYESEKLDKPFSIFIAFIFSISLLLYYLIPIIFTSQLKLLSELNHYKVLYLNLTGFTTFWILYSLNESIIYKENLNKKFGSGVVSIILILIVTSAVLSSINQFNLNSFSLLFFISGFLIWLLQFFILKKAGVLFINTLIVSIVILTFFIMYNYFI